MQKSEQLALIQGRDRCLWTAALRCKMRSACSHLTKQSFCLRHKTLHCRTAEILSVAFGNDKRDWFHSLPWTPLLVYWLTGIFFFEMCFKCSKSLHFTRIEFDFCPTEWPQVCSNASLSKVETVLLAPMGRVRVDFVTGRIPAPSAYMCVCVTSRFSLQALHV